MKKKEKKVFDKIGGKERKNRAFII